MDMDMDTWTKTNVRCDLHIHKSIKVVLSTPSPLFIRTEEPTLPGSMWLCVSWWKVTCMHAKLEGYTIGFGIEPSGSDRTLGNGIENPRDRTRFTFARVRVFHGTRWMRSDSRERFVGSRKFMLCYVMVVRSGPGRAIHGVHAMAHAVSLNTET